MKYFYGFDSIDALTEHCGRTEWIIDAELGTVAIPGVGIFDMRNCHFQGEWDCPPKEARCQDYEWKKWEPGDIAYTTMSMLLPLCEYANVEVRFSKDVWRETGERIR